MADKIWPTDKLGNPIREGKLVRLDLPEPAGFFYVMGVTPATILQSGDGPYPVNGEIEMVLKFKMPFSPERCELMKAVVVEQPKVDDPKIGLQ
jgi:hypothetical protein